MSIICCWIMVDLGATCTLVCQSDPTRYKSDPKSTSSWRLVPKTAWGDLGKKQPTFDLKSTSDMALCCLSSFIMIALWGLRLSIRVSVVIRQNFHLRITSQICRPNLLRSHDALVQYRLSYGSLHVRRGLLITALFNFALYHQWHATTQSCRLSSHRIVYWV